MFDSDFRKAFLDWLVRERGKTGKSAQEYYYQLTDVTRVRGCMLICILFYVEMCICVDGN